MVADRLQLRKRVVQFLELFRYTHDDWRSLTVNHFMAEGRSRSTIYSIIDTFLRRGSVEQKTGERIMTPYNKKRLRKAARFNCDQSYISKTLKMVITIPSNVVSGQKLLYISQMR